MNGYTETEGLKGLHLPKKLLFKENGGNLLAIIT